VYNKTKRYADADDVASLALTIAERASLGQSSETASLLESRGETRYSQRRFSEGQQDIARALEIRLKERPPRHDRVIEDYNLFATFCMAQEKFDEAIKAFHLVADSRKRRFGPSHPAYGWALSNLAFCYAGRGRWDDAEPVAREGFGILNGQQNRLHAAPDLARAADCLGRICLAKHKLADAEAYLKIAIAILDEFGDKEIDRTPLLRNYANTLERLGRRAEAQVFWKRIHESPQGEHPAGYVEY
jgi:tetratricopeptide (TPR) repeat protein